MDKPTLFFIIILWLASLLLVSTTTYVYKDVYHPCPAVSCEPVVKIPAEIGGKRGVWVGTIRVIDSEFYPEAEK